MDWFKTLWPVVLFALSAVFAVGGYVQRLRSQEKEDAMRDQAAADRETRIRKLEERPHPGAGPLCSQHQDKLTELGVITREIRSSLHRIEKKLDIAGE